MRLSPQFRHSRRLSLSRLSPNGSCWKTQLTVCLVAVFLLAPLRAQEIEGAKSPSVDLIRPGITAIPGGTAGEVQLQFRIGRGFHINSNTPKSEFLIPTTLKLDAPTDIVIGRVSYPQGEEKSFPFSPDEKLSVYTGDFTVAVTVRPLHTVVPGKYMFRGQLRYQACDNAACYPPKQLPVNFEVKVAKAATTHGRNPAQSPHVHH